jgi:hypothetical protein
MHSFHMFRPPMHPTNVGKSAMLAVFTGVVRKAEIDVLRNSIGVRYLSSFNTHDDKTNEKKRVFCRRGHLDAKEKDQVHVVTRFLSWHTSSNWGGGGNWRSKQAKMKAVWRIRARSQATAGYVRNDTDTCIAIALRRSTLKRTKRTKGSSRPFDEWTKCRYGRKLQMMNDVSVDYQNYAKVYGTRYSQAVTHPSTNRARRCLTSVIGREPVLSTWYGRRRQSASTSAI